MNNLSVTSSSLVESYFWLYWHDFKLFILHTIEVVILISSKFGLASKSEYYFDPFSAYSSIKNIRKYIVNYNVSPKGGNGLCFLCIWATLATGTLLHSRLGMARVARSQGSGQSNHVVSYMAWLCYVWDPWKHGAILCFIRWGLGGDAQNIFGK